MSWVRIDDQFHNHPKVARLDWLQLPAVGLHVLALCWCNGYLTDGFVPKGQIIKLCGDLGPLLPMGTADPIVGALLDAGLWEEVEGGYQIHDYLEYQPSKYEVTKQRAALSKERSKAGSRGAASREAKRMQNGSKAPSKAQAPGPYPNPSPVITNPVVEEEALGRRNVFVLYDQYMGKPSVTGMIREQLIQAEEDYGEACLEHCFAEAAASSDGRRSWSYVRAICERHKTEGCESVHEGKRMGSNTGPAPQAEGDAAARAYASMGITSLPRVYTWEELDELRGANGGVEEVDGHDDPPGVAGVGQGRAAPA